MVKCMKKIYRIEVATGELLKKNAYWWTLTTKDVCDYSEIAQRWRRVRHWFNGKFNDFKYIQNFEVHPKGHGWHVHFVCNRFINLCSKSDYNKIQSFGFGRVEVRRCYSNDLHEYLSKHALKAYKRLPDRPNKRFRIVNVSRSLDCPLSRFVPVFGLTDRWGEVSKIEGQYHAKQLVVPFQFE